ncbi:pyridoxal phosphate-dependent transferase [Melampsora americana]|nr:pyridoxal phosphate-dependent transferase [Melampsora americana]
MNNSLNQRIQNSLNNRIEKSSLRTLDTLTQDPSILDFSSNDYLSFSKSDQLNHSFQINLKNSNHSAYGPSSSRLLDGNTSLHLNLESQLRLFFKGNSALIFNSGYDANLSIWSTIGSLNDYILFDEFLHASFHDGIKLSKTKVQNRIKFKHNDLSDFKHQLFKLFNQDENLRNGRLNLFIGIESLYSMNGDLCPIQDFIQIIEEFNQKDNIHLIIDEAHSTGLYGQSGQGLTLSLNLHHHFLIRLYTFGKAGACSGAVVITSSLIRNYLINYSRPLIYSSTLPHMNIIAIQTVLHHFQSDHHRKAVLQLKNLSSYLKTQLETLINSNQSSSSMISINPPNQTIQTSSRSSIQFFSPIFPIYTTEPIQLSKFLLNCQIRVRPIRFPTVPIGHELIRICLNSNLNQSQIDLLISSLQSWLNQLNPKFKSKL